MLDIVFNPDDVVYFLLILVRISTIMAVVPIFGTNFVPRPWKIAFSLILSLITYLALSRPSGFVLQLSAFNLLLASMREALLGLVIGTVVGLVFSAVLLAGQVIGTQMGLGLANVLDPQHGVNVSIVAQLHFLLATVFFLAVDGHHLVMNGIMDTFRFFPAGELSFPFGSMWEIAQLSGKVFVAAVQLAASLIVLLLLVSASLGIIARTVPQMNIFIVGFPLKLLVGIFGLGASIPYVTRALVGLFEEIPSDLARVLGAV